MGRCPLAPLLALSIATLTAGCQTGDKVDKSFDTHVARPAYLHDGPVILFDDAHHNWHRPSGSYRPFVRLVESDGCRVRANKETIAADVLTSADILVVAAAVGNNERNDDDAFASAECDAIREWVQSGGALLLIVDHYPTGDAVEELASRFGVALSKGVAEDPVHHDPERDSSHIVFSRDNGGLTPHPINDGRDSSERIERVLTFTGEAVRAAPPRSASSRSRTAPLPAPRFRAWKTGARMSSSTSSMAPVCPRQDGRKVSRWNSVRGASWSWAKPRCFPRA